MKLKVVFIISFETSFHFFIAASALSNGSSNLKKQIKAIKTVIISSSDAHAGCILYKMWLGEAN